VQICELEFLIQFVALRLKSGGALRIAS
jgi:hypothetical protein